MASMLASSPAVSSSPLSRTGSTSSRLTNSDCSARFLIHPASTASHVFLRHSHIGLLGQSHRLSICNRRRGPSPRAPLVTRAYSAGRPNEGGSATSLNPDDNDKDIPAGSLLTNDEDMHAATAASAPLQSSLSAANDDDEPPERSPLLLIASAAAGAASFGLMGFSSDVAATPSPPLDPPAIVASINGNYAAPLPSIALMSPSSPFGMDSLTLSMLTAPTLVSPAAQASNSAALFAPPVTGPVSAIGKTASVAPWSEPPSMGNTATGSVVATSVVSLSGGNSSGGEQMGGVGGGSAAQGGAASAKKVSFSRGGESRRRSGKAITLGQLGRLGGLPWTQQRAADDVFGRKAHSIEMAPSATSSSAASVGGVLSSPGLFGSVSSSGISSNGSTSSSSSSGISTSALCGRLSSGGGACSNGPAVAVSSAHGVEFIAADAVAAPAAASSRARSTATASLPASAISASAVSGAASVVSSAVTSPSSLINLPVLRASLSAAFKLFSICSFIVWLMKAKILPETTPAVLSQVAFRAMIPCFLMSKVASTLATQPFMMLAGLPLVAIMQVMVGAILGKIACTIAYHNPTSSSSSPPLSTLFPFLSSSSSSARQVAQSVALSFGLSHQSAAAAADFPGQLAARNNVGAAARAAQKKEAVVTAACAFGNSLTLPLVFLTALLSPADADRAAGYLALFMVGWSPAFWTIGYSLFTGGETSEGGEEGEPKSQLQATKEYLAQAAKNVFNPPIYGVIAGLLIGATPLGHFFLPAGAASSAAAAAASLAASEASLMDGVGGLSLGWSEVGGPFARLASLLFSPATAGLLHPLVEAAAILGSACVAVQAVVLASSLAASVPNKINLPNIPWDRFFPNAFANAPAAANAADPSAASIQQLLQQKQPASENGQVTALVPISIEASSSPSLVSFGSNQMPLMQNLPMREILVERNNSTAAFAAAAGSSSFRAPPATAAAAAAVLVSPSSSSPSALPTLLDGRALWVVCIVRLVLLPMVGMFGIMALYQANFIPQDPICAFSLMVQTAMPSAQNLVLMSQLSPATRPMAGVLASMMLKQYALAMLPITIWMTIFISQLGLSI